MSDTTDESDGEQTDSPDEESGQTVSGQPQAEQPQSGQPQGGQPQSTQPQAGQPQGGYQPQQPAQTGPSVGDIFSRRDTMARMKAGVVFAAVVGVGMLIAAILGALISYGWATDVLSGAYILGPAAAALFAFRDADILTDVPDNLVYATAAVIGGAETVVLVIFGLFGGLMAAALASNPVVEFPAGDYFLVGIMVAIGAVVVGVLTVWAKRNFLAPSPGPQRRTP